MANIQVYARKTPQGPEYRWRVRARNGEILGASTEAFTRRSSALRNLQTLDQYDTGEAIYTDSSGRVRWRLIARNGNIVHASSEAFSSRAMAKKNLERLVSAVKSEQPGKTIWSPSGRPFV